VITDNPLIKRYKYSLMRPRQFWVYMIIYISILLMIFLINYSGYKNDVLYKTTTDLFRSLYYQFLVMQVIILWIWASFNSGSAIREEVFDKTFDFFRMFPITARTKAVGILAGKNLITLLLAACNFVLLVIFGIAGELNPNLQWQVILVIVSVSILTNTAILLFSINPRGRKRRSEIIGFVLLAFFLGPAIINGVLAIARYKNIETKLAWFFEVKIPVLVLASLIVLYFCCWTIIGILRKFTYEDEPMFSRPGAILFVLGYEIVVMGLFYHFFKDIHPRLLVRTLNLAFWFISLAPVVMIPLASIRTYEKYIEFAGFLIKRPDRRLNPLRLVLYSNIALWKGMFAVWALFAMLTAYLSELPLLENLLVIVVIFSFYLFVILLLEANVLISPFAPKIGVLLGFILGVYIVLPLVLSGVLEIDALVPHSPFGYVSNLFEKTSREFMTDARVLAVNVAMCLAPAIVILGRYINVINARVKM
jgi:hypothetical protein